MATPGEIRDLRQIERDRENARQEAENKIAKPGNTASGGSGAGLSLYGQLLGLNDPSIFASLLGGRTAANDGQGPTSSSSTFSALSAKGDAATNTSNLQNALLGEQLTGARTQNAQSRMKRKGGGIGGMGVGGYGGTQPAGRMQTPLPDVYANTQNRAERGKDMALDRNDYETRATFDAGLQNTQADEEDQRKLELLKQLLGRLGGGSQTSTGTSTTNAGEYQNIGGRPVYMPTSSTTNTSQTTPFNKAELIRLLGF